MVALDYSWPCGDPSSHMRFVDALCVMENADRVPPFVLGAARYVIDETPPERVNQQTALATLPLVTAEFWRDARIEFEGFPWYVQNPNEARPSFESLPDPYPDPRSNLFSAQWDMTIDLLGILSSAGAVEGALLSDARRKQAASKIVRESKKLRRLLDEYTGHTRAGEWRGLGRQRARDLFTHAGREKGSESFAVVPSDFGPGSIDFKDWRIHNAVSLQDLLRQAERQIASDAVYISTDTAGRGRKDRFIRALQRWLTCRRSWDDDERGYYASCAATADKVLEVLHPEVDRPPHAGRSTRRRAT